MRRDATCHSHDVVVAIEHHEGPSEANRVGVLIVDTGRIGIDATFDEVGFFFVVNPVKGA